MLPEITDLFLRTFAAAFYAWVFGLSFRRTWSRKQGCPPSDREHPQKPGSKSVTVDFVTVIRLFPTGLAIIFAGFVWTRGWRNAPACFFRFASDLMLTMSVYYVVLLLLLPALRRHISARACAAAWLLPTYLYYIVFLVRSSPMPRVVLYCPAQIIDLLVPVWFAGFAAVFAGFLVSHLCFCRRIQQTITDECNGTALAIWEQELDQSGTKTRVRLARCPLAATPFSVSRQKEVLTVLPTSPYTPEELRLIFRHELYHIRRGDASAKLFFAFLRALFWFHPLVWISARESSRDMELSCDEAVLEGADDATRKRYAALLLHTAGEPRGFTTCLSADARSLRYRLKHTVQERACLPGTKLLMALLFLCVMCHGMFAFSDERCTLGQLFADAGAIDHFLYEVYDRETGSFQSLSDADLREGAGEELLAYLSSLCAEHLIGSAEQRTDLPEHSPRLYFSDKEGSLQGIWLYDGGITIYDWYQTDNSARCRVYYIREDIDWEKIRACYK